MFSFHKPKIYRSALGCCICRAKSSSSRFTDSKKYEPEFARCFRIVEEDRRSGEICNACVLLVKRWKKLPPGTTRDWHHVVDARAGPGTKCVNKGKVKPPKRPLKKHRRRHRLGAEKRCKMDIGGGALSDDVTGRWRYSREMRGANSIEGLFAVAVGDDSMSESSLPSPPESRATSPTPSNSSEDEDSVCGLLEEEEEERGRRRGAKGGKKKKPRDGYLLGRRAKSAPFRISSFLDMSFWRKEKVCCGIIFKGPHGEVLIYPKLLRPCRCRRRLGSAPSVVLAAPPALPAEDSGTTPTTPEDDVAAAAALLFPTPEISDCNPSSPDASRGSASLSGGSD
ncbi:unnamed protein product [Ixodes pacificus]